MAFRKRLLAGCPGTDPVAVRQSAKELGALHGCRYPGYNVR
jgi:hypothetical protein